MGQQQRRTSAEETGPRPVLFLVGGMALGLCVEVVVVRAAEERRERGRRSAFCEGVSAGGCRDGRGRAGTGRTSGRPR